MGLSFSTRLPDLVHQEIWAWLLVHHAISALITRAAGAADIDPDRISFTRTLRITPPHRHRYGGLFPLRRPCCQIRVHAALVKILCRCVVRVLSGGFPVSQAS